MTGPTRTAHRIRVVSDNDYAGDPDGLFQLAHLALSASVDLRGVIASHLAPGDAFDDSGDSAAHGADEARTVLDLVDRDGVPVVAGSEDPLTSDVRGRVSDAAQLIIDEALREDDLPLYVTFGGGLTELAAAYLAEPAIADRLTAVWIGGPEHPGLGSPPPPGAAPVEYNLAIDLAAAQVVFDSPIPLWQVPRDAYRQTLVSMPELAVRVRPHGRIGKHLYASLEQVAERAAAAGHNLGETYIVGDNPLVLLTALMSSFEMDPSSSRHVEIPRPRISDDGSYESRDSGAPMRVYTELDVRLMMEDLYAKLAVHAASSA